MTHSLAARLRRLWLDVHLWIGAGLLIVLLPLGLSGAVLVWHDPLDRALHAERYAVSGAGGAPIEAYAAAAQGVFAGRAALSQIRVPAHAGDPVVALGRLPGPVAPGVRPRTLNAWIDPASARVLGVAEVARGFTMVLHRLHGTLLIPEVGRKVVGWLGWAMFVSCATGLWLWWPRHSGLLRALKWRRGASQLFNLHHAVGFWTCLPLAILSLTGVIISFPQTAERLVGHPPPPPRDAAAQRARNAQPLVYPVTSLPQALAAARAVGPDAPIVAVNWPQKGDHPSWRIEFKGQGAKSSAVVVDDGSGEARPARGGGGPQRSAFAAWSRRIHDGSDMGDLWRVIITLAGLAPAVLGLSGIVMWLRRRRRQRALHRPA